MTEASNRNPLDALKVALELEREGKQFFEETARRFESPLARRTFEFLAAEEERHIERIQEFYQIIADTGSTETAVIEESRALDRLTEFQSRLSDLKGQISPSATDIEAYEYALRFENGAEEFYEQSLLEATDANVRRFYQWLIKEEEMHSRLLESCLAFARDPAQWFKEEA